MRRLLLIFGIISLPSLLLAQFTVQELENYLSTAAAKDSSIIVDTWEDQHFQGDYLRLESDTLIFRNIITKSILRLPLTKIEFVRNGTGEYYFDGDMYREAKSPTKTAQNQQVPLDTTLSSTPEIVVPQKSTTIVMPQKPRNQWKHHNPDGEIGVPYLILGSGGHLRRTRYLSENGEVKKETFKSIINPSFNAGLILPASPRATLELMYQYDSQTLDNRLSGFSSRESDHYVYLQMKIKLGK